MSAPPAVPPETSRREVRLRPVVSVALVAALAGPACSERGPSAPVVPDQVAEITDLVGLGGRWARALGISAAGRVVGEASLPTGNTSRAFHSRAGIVQDLGTLGGLSSAATAINDRGQIVGWAELASGQRRAFLTVVGVAMRDLGVPPGGILSQAADITDEGTVTGSWIDGEGRLRAFRWTATDGVRDIGDVAGYVQLQGIAVNTRGEFLLAARAAGTFQLRGLIWSTAAGAVEIPMRSDVSALVPWGMNSDGHVVGAMTTTGGEQRAFVWTRGPLPRDLGTLPGMDWSVATAISDQGHVVGYSGVAGSEFGRAFRWTEAGGMQSLAVLRTGDDAESAAFGVNFAGTAVGYSWNGTQFRPVVFPAQAK